MEPPRYGGRIRAADRARRTGHDVTDDDTATEIRRGLFEGATGRPAEAIEAVRDGGGESMRVDELGPAYHPSDIRKLAAYARKRFR